MWNNPEDPRRLWLGMAAGPIGWVLAFGGVYALSAKLCEQRTGQLHGMILIGLIVAGFGVWLAWKNWKAVGGALSPKDAGALARSRLLSSVSLMGNCLLTAAILTQWMAVALLSPCEPV